MFGEKIVVTVLGAIAVAAAACAAMHFGSPLPTQAPITVER